MISLSRNPKVPGASGISRFSSISRISSTPRSFRKARLAIAGLSLRPVLRSCTIRPQSELIARLLNDAAIGLKPDQNPTRRAPKAVQKSSEGGVEAVQKRTLEVDVARPSLNELPTSTRQVLNAIANDCFMTQRGLVSKIGLAKSTIIKATAILIKNGYLRRVGPKKGVRWEVVG